MSQQAARAFFDAWNRRAMDVAMAYVAGDCHYDDFGFVRPPAVSGPNDPVHAPNVRLHQQAREGVGVRPPPLPCLKPR